MKPEKFYPRTMKRADRAQAALDALKTALLSLSALPCECEETTERAYACAHHRAEALLEQAIAEVSRVGGGT